MKLYTDDTCTEEIEEMDIHDGTIFYADFENPLLKNGWYYFTDCTVRASDGMTDRAGMTPMGKPKFADGKWTEAA